jgi:hypothetical protein
VGETNSCWPRPEGGTAADAVNALSDASGTASWISRRSPPRCSATSRGWTGWTTRGRPAGTAPEPSTARRSPRPTRSRPGRRDVGPADRGAHHPRHPAGHLRHRARAAGPAVRPAQGRRPDGRPADDPAAAGRLPADGDARAVRGLHGPPGRLPALHGGQRRSGPRGPGRRADRGPDRDRARHRPARAAAGHSGRGVADRRPRSSCPSRPTATVSSRHRQVRPPGRAGFLEALLGKYREASREEPGLCSAPHGDELYKTQIRAWTSLDIDAAELHRIGLEELASIEAERGSSPATWASATTRRRPGPALRATRRNPRVDRGAARPRPRPDRARPGRRARLLRQRCPAPAARFGRSSRTRRPTRRRPTTTRPRSTAAGPASTTSTPTTCRAAATSAWPA